MERLIGGRRVEVRAKSGHWSRLIPGRRFARFQAGAMPAAAAPQGSPRLPELKCCST